MDEFLLFCFYLILNSTSRYVYSSLTFGSIPASFLLPQGSTILSWVLFLPLDLLWLPTVLILLYFQAFVFMVWDNSIKSVVGSSKTLTYLNTLLMLTLCGFTKLVKLWKDFYPEYFHRLSRLGWACSQERWWVWKIIGRKKFTGIDVKGKETEVRIWSSVAWLRVFVSFPQ